MRFTLTIDCGNAAFDDEGHELARILHELADSVAYPGNGMQEAKDTLRDINGNKVGRWEMAEPAPPRDDFRGFAQGDPITKL